MGISALIVAKNEEKNLDNCLKRLTFVEQIVVIVDESTDNTKNIALNYTKFVYEGSWSKEGERRNFGLSKCQNEWILEIDADEIVEKDLAREIIEKVSYGDKDYFYLPLLNYVCNIPIKYGWMACLAPDGKYCLFRKSSKVWKKGRVHPEYEIKGRKGPKLKNFINHYMSKDISDLIIRFDRNTTLSAIDLNENKKNLKKFFSKRKILSRFIKCFIVRKGFKKLGIGFLISFLSSIYPFVSAIKAKSLEK